MEKLNAWLEEKFLPVASKVASYKYLFAARDAFFSSIPFIMVGSLFLVVSFIAIPGWDAIVGPHLGNILVGYGYTMGILSIWISITYGYSLAKYYDLEPISGATISLMAFLVVAAKGIEGGLSNAYFSGEGIFTAMLTSIFAVEVLRFCVKRKITIKLPESVPPMISASFGALIPVAFVVIVLGYISFWLNFDLSAFILNLFKPLVVAGDSFFAVVFIAFLVALLFYLGIHGWAVILGVIGPIEMANITANAAAHAAGEPLPHVLTEPFFAAWGSIGGTTTAGALVIWCLLAKSKQLKQAGRISAIPSFAVNVHEPAMFSVPTVLNPYFFIPVVFTYPILAGITWIAMNAGLVTKPFINVTWSTPNPFYPYLATGGDWRAVVLMFFNLAVGLAIYYPFVRAYDKVLLKQEQQEAAE